MPEPASERDYTTVEDARLKDFVLAADNQFRIWTGRVDLLKMSSELTAQEFRMYIGACRELRRRERAAK